jgi:SecD/SecF fusion protein
MQLKGLVKVITLLIIAICLYQLSFTYFVNNFEKKQAGIAEKETIKANPTLKKESPAFVKAFEERKRYRLDSLSSEKVAYGQTYAKSKDQELKLGLDLQGGMNVVLEVGTSDLIRNYSNNPQDPAMGEALKSAVNKKAGSNKNLVDLFASEYLAKNSGAKLANLFSKPGREGINLNTDNDAVIAKIKEEAALAVNNTYEVIRKRIDKFGVASPTINIDRNKDIITVELAGVQNPEKVREQLQSSAKLEFWETYSNYELQENLDKANKALAVSLGGVAVKDTSNTKKDTAKNLLGDLGKLSNDSTAKLDKLRKENPLFAVMQPMPIQPQADGKLPTNAIIGTVANFEKEKLQEYFNSSAVKSNFPSDFKIMFGRPSAEEIAQGAKYSYVYAIKTDAGRETAKLTGEHVVEARSDINPFDNKPEISMKMDQEGAVIWEKLTGSNIGKPIAIALDNIIYSAPAPSEAIGGGRSSINGSFTVEDTKDVASILASGRIDAPAKIVQEQVVGPSLGAENIAKGKMSFLIAFLVIFALMLIYYNSAGMVANIALILNLLFTVGALTSLGFTLTMAGIAGLILTIGMAVDTNVIIFERIKEELVGGKNHIDAVNEGYKRSLAPVLDGHITVFLTAAILFYFGLGAVKGFATTQMVGIALSLFCGILVSRVLTDLYMNGKNGTRHLEYFSGIGRKLFKGFNFHFIEWRKKAYIISIAVLIAGVGSMFYGFDYGIEFKGGRNYEVNLPQKVSLNKVKDALKTSFGSYPEVKTIGGSGGNGLSITTDYLVDKGGDTAENEVLQKLYTGLTSINAVPAGLTPEQFKKDYAPFSQTVQPTISKELKAGAIKATIFSLIIIFIYILIRFRKWQYSLGTLVALLHDILVALAVFSFFRKIVPFSLQIDQHFIAAILTVIGFSMNDTVIVFDRIREYFRKEPNGDKVRIINSAINDTLSRTIMTSLTVFLTILILFFVGGEATKGFAFAMLIGVITGTYSSIFVASPILVDLDKSGKLSNEVDREAKIKELKELA